MNNDLKVYVENMKKPWSVMFYRLIWEQLPQLNASKILDFGSGLGITANHLAKNNDVVAIERNADMAEIRICENSYKQIIGDIEQLRDQEDDSFDVVVCHNALEYSKERKDIFREFYRVLKPNGIISIVKHNHAGRIMQKAIFENNLDEAIMLLALHSNNEIRYDPIWQEKMFELEMKASDMEEYINISFYNHVFLKKLS